MMKKLIIMGALLLASTITGEAIAACGGPGWNQQTNLVSLLTNNNASLGMTACNLDGQGTQEEHHNDNTLWDFKCGPTGYPATGPGTACANPDTDRRRQLGNWSVADNGGTDATVSYNYTAFGSASSGPFKVYRRGQQYDFCTIGGTSVGIFRLVSTSGTNRVCP